MKKHKALKGALAAVLALATMAGTTSMAYAADGKSAEELAEHGGAQRIATIGNENAKNVILFIGDGMGDSEITVARNYLHGASGSFDGLDAIGQASTYGDDSVGTGQYTTYSLGSGIEDKGTPTVTSVTDSAASASAWATGTKTYNNAVDVDAYGTPQLNLTELAKAAGKATGNVTTSEIQDATPAAQMSHSTLRSCYGPQGKTTDGESSNADASCEASQLKENGGIGSISEQLLDTRADVTLGGGNGYFNQVVQGGEYEGMTLAEQAEAMGYQYITDPEDLDSIEAADQDTPLLGLFASGNLPTKYSSSVATPQDESKDANPITCQENPEWLGNSGVSLADMTSKAIDLLSANENGQENGYFLQVEAASIDKQDHNANACGQIGETDDLDQAIAAALEKVDLSETLIIVTADHAHTSQIVEEQPAYALSTVLQSPVDGSIITVSYGTSSDQMYADDENASFDEIESSMSHTGTQLRIAASGPGAERVTGLTDQTDNFYTIAGVLGLATTSEEIAALSDNADANLVIDNDGQRIEFSGFNGDASVSYTVTDTATSNVLVDSSSSSSDPSGVSGVRVKTTQTMSIDLTDQLTEGNTYSVTITGLQSGKVVTKEFQVSTTPGSSTVIEGESVDNGTATASDDETNIGGVLGKTGSAMLAIVIVVAALVASALALKRIKNRQ